MKAMLQEGKLIVESRFYTVEQCPKYWPVHCQKTSSLVGRPAAFDVHQSTGTLDLRSSLTGK